MSELPPELRTEIEDALRNNEGQLGKVFALFADGKTTMRLFRYRKQVVLLWK